ncbi:hypothetical protein HHE06_00830 [Helicobacter heilmannii]|uniref:hypothetical protein n=1 Tax=Helicobacter heilmannii TaxID=35817 RepID=UPI0006A083B2|nr:hypothetical protein [Helicobacter heilmannii]CRF50262.1 hypothetical protein HHE06_00830 [Helicobacter heilmannii]
MADNPPPENAIRIKCKGRREDYEDYIEIILDRPVVGFGKRIEEENAIVCGIKSNAFLQKL